MREKCLSLASVLPFTPVEMVQGLCNLTLKTDSLIKLDDLSFYIT